MAEEKVLRNEIKEIRKKLCDGVIELTTFFKTNLDRKMLEKFTLIIKNQTEKTHRDKRTKHKLKFEKLGQQLQRNTASIKKLSGNKPDQSTPL